MKKSIITSLFLLCIFNLNVFGFVVDRYTDSTVDNKKKFKYQFEGTNNLQTGNSGIESDITLSANIVFTNNLGNIGGTKTIDGQGRYALKGDGNLGLNINSGGRHLTLKDITIENMKRGVYLANVNSTFTTEGTVTFLNNKFDGTNDGGGVNINGRKADFRGTEISFIGNSARDGGGAYFQSGASANFNASSVNFQGNTSRNNGGGMFLTGSGSTAVFSSTETIFHGNIAERSGGALYIADSSAVTFSGKYVEFSSNISKNQNNQPSAGGGAIYATGNTTVNFINSDVSFLGNQTANGGAGGAIYITGNNSLFNFLDSSAVFSNNTASNGGGAIELQSSSKLNINSSNILFNENKTASNAGGAIHAMTSNISIENSTTVFKKNESAANGGAMDLHNSSNLTAKNSGILFENNKAHASGGAIYADKGSVLNFDNSIIGFTMNTAAVGGAIFAGGDNTQIQFTSSIISFKNNTILGTGSGGAVSLGGDSSSNAKINFDYSDVSFLSNSTANGGSGGAIYLKNAAMNFTGGNILFSLNSTGNTGGAIYLDSAAKIEFSGNESVIFSGNSASSGGALYLKTKSVLSFTGIKNLEFNGNNALVGNGGAVYLDGNSNISFLDTDIKATGNSATSGGFLYSNSVGDINFSNVSLASNTATGSGGAIFAGSGTNLIFSGTSTVVSHNIATENGGAIFLDGTAKADFSKTTLEASNNKAKSGGFLYSNSAGNINFSDVFLKNNIAAASGGAIYVNSGTNLIFSGTTTVINYNNASEKGGGVLLNGSAKVDFLGTTLEAIGNKAVDGGFLYSSSAGNITVGDARLTNNIATGDGGAIYVNSGTNLIFSGTTTVISNNSATGNGGAIYVYDGSISEFKNAVFNDNTALLQGGALYVEGYSTTAIAQAIFNTSLGSQTIFSGNKADGASNAIYAGRYSEINFKTDINGVVEMYDGIAGSSENAKMFFKGDGKFNLYANSESNYADISIISGKFYIKNGANLSAGSFVNDSSSSFNMQDGKINTLTAKNFTNDGKLDMDIFATEESDQIIVSGNVFLSTSSSILNTTIDSPNSRFRKKIFKLINYGGNLNGTFNSVSIDGISLSTPHEINYGDLLNNWITLTLYGNSTGTNFSGLKKLSFNQKQVAGVYDMFSEDSNGDLDFVISLIESESDEKGQKRALSQTAGYFLANVIRSGGADAGNNEIYSRISKEEHDLSDKGVWVQGKVNVVTNKGDDNSLNDYVDTSVGAIIGYDMLLPVRDLIFGVYGKFNNHSISQDPGSTADAVNTGLGVYGGYIKSRWEVKALLSGSFDTYNTERNISFADRKAKADFNGMTINADIEGALKMEINEKTKLKYYAGMEVINTNYDEIKESGAQSLNLIVSGASYQRMSGRVGLGINQNKNTFDWYINAEYKLLLEGNLPEIESKFEGTGEVFNIRGSEEGKGIIGANAGGSVNLTGNLKLFANASYYTADKYNNIYGNLGVRWAFAAAGMPKTDKSDKESRRKIKQEAGEIKEREKKLKADIKAYEKTINSAEKEKIKSERKLIENEKLENPDRDNISTQKEAVKKAKAEAKKARQEEKQIDARIASYEKTRKKAEKEKIKTEQALLKKEKSSKTDKSDNKDKELPIETAQQEEKTAEDARIFEYEIMLAAEQRKEEARVKAEKTRAGETARQKKLAQAKLDEKRKKKTSSEINDDELAIRKKEVEDRVLKPILESFEVKFMSAKDDLSPHWKIELQKQSEAIKKYEYNKISIEGHADSSEDTPKKLSRLRAKTVYNELISNGIPEEKINYIGLSSVLPADSNSSEAGRMANRRVVVIVE